MNRRQVKKVIHDHIIFDSSCKTISDLSQAVVDAQTSLGLNAPISAWCCLGLFKLELLHWEVSSPVKIHSARASANAYEDFFPKTNSERPA
jgi:hypothetical protein